MIVGHVHSDWSSVLKFKLKVCDLFIVFPTSIFKWGSSSSSSLDESDDAQMLNSPPQPGFIVAMVMGPLLHAHTAYPLSLSALSHAHSERAREKRQGKKKESEREVCFLTHALEWETTCTLTRAHTHTHTCIHSVSC